MRDTSIDHFGGRARRNVVGRFLFVVAVAGVLGAASATVGRADAPRPLGGLALTPYCQSLGYDGDTLTKPQLGPNAAYNNWRCFTGTSSPDQSAPVLNGAGMQVPVRAERDPDASHESR
jgi:hypothetical protein